MWAESNIAPAVDTSSQGVLPAAPVYPAPDVRPSWFSSFWDDTSVSCPSFGDGALGGVSLLRASELNESSDEDCSARDLAGLQKVWHQLIYLCLGNPGSIDVFGF